MRTVLVWSPNGQTRQTGHPSFLLPYSPTVSAFRVEGFRSLVPIQSRISSLPIVLSTTVPKVRRRDRLCLDPHPVSILHIHAPKIDAVLVSRYCMKALSNWFVHVLSLPITQCRERTRREVQDAINEGDTTPVALGSPRLGYRLGPP